MKKIFLLVTLLCSINTADAQQKSPLTYRHDVRIGLGLYPIIIRNYYDYDNIIDVEAIGCKSDETYSSKRVYSPSLNATYSYRFTRFFALETNISFNANYEHYNDLYTDKLLLKDSRSRISILPVARFYWNNPRNLVSVYSSAGIGVAFKWERNIEGREGANSFDVIPIFHINPIGVSIGRRLYGFAELGAGSIGVFQIGVGYRFNYKK